MKNKGNFKRLRMSLSAAELFHQWSPRAWGLWLIAFGSGVVIHLFRVELTLWQWFISTVAIVALSSAIYHNLFVSPLIIDSLAKGGEGEW